MESSQKTISIKAGEDFSESGLRRFFQNAFGSTGNGDLGAALDLMVDPNDARMSVDEVEVGDIRFYADSGSVEIDYEVRSSSYYGCRDQNSERWDDGCVGGDLIDGNWIFPVHIYPERQSPNEEL